MKTLQNIQQINLALAYHLPLKISKMFRLPLVRNEVVPRKKIKCIEDKVTRGKIFINVWYIVIAAIVIPVIVVVLLVFL